MKKKNNVYHIYGPRKVDEIIKEIYTDLDITRVTLELEHTIQSRINDWSMRYYIHLRGL